MKKERGFVKAKLILRGGGVFSHTPGTQASKNISVSIGLRQPFESPKIRQIFTKYFSLRLIKIKESPRVLPSFQRQPWGYSYAFAPRLCPKRSSFLAEL